MADKQASLADGPDHGKAAAGIESADGAKLPLRAEIGDLEADERRVLECLGAAVVSIWSKLARSEQRAIFEYAAAQQTYDTAALRKQIAQFLHDHNE